jgi:putative endonuclease
MFVKSFTAKADDWELYLSITDLDYQQARLIELHIKKMKSTKYIKDLIKYPQIIEKLKERYP